MSMTQEEFDRRFKYEYRLAFDGCLEFRRPDSEWLPKMCPLSDWIRCGEQCTFFAVGQYQKSAKSISVYIECQSGHDAAVTIADNITLEEDEVAETSNNEG